LSLGEPEGKEPPPLDIGDWEAPISDRYRPDKVPPHPWQAAPACGGKLPLLIVEDRTAAYSRLQERGQKMQLALRGRVQTAPCKLAPGRYSVQWRAYREHELPAHTQLQVRVWEHPPGDPPRVLHTGVVQAKKSWMRYTEQLHVRRGMPYSLEIRWLDGPGYPDIVDGQPQIALTLDPRVQIEAETTP
jgi:hypothetical protein